MPYTAFTHPAFEQAACNWAEANPETAAWLAGVDSLGYRACVFSSEVATEVALELGLPVPAPADDTDLLVHPDDFDKVADLLPHALIERQSMRIRTGDGLALRMVAEDARGTIAGRQVQILRPHTPLGNHIHQYNTAFTDQAVDARIHVRTPRGIVPWAHPLETLLHYGIAQRRRPKHDLSRARAILRVYTPVDDYAARRGAEMQADERVWAFVARAGAALTPAADVRLAA